MAFERGTVLVNDYPSAHSMDISWFGVDKCGHVAAFHSGLEAAVPKKEKYDWGLGRLSSDVGRGLQKGEMKELLEGKLLPVGCHEARGSAGDGTTYGAWWLRSEDVQNLAVTLALMAPPAGRPVLGDWFTPRIEKHDGFDFLLGDVPKRFIDLVHSEPGRCLGCWKGPLYGYYGLDNLYGVYRYGEIGQETGPYARVLWPKHPRLIQEIRERLKMPSRIPMFPFCFKEKKRIQPIEWIPVSVYNSPKVQEWKPEAGKKRTGVKGASGWGGAG